MSDPCPLGNLFIIQSEPCHEKSVFKVFNDVVTNRARRCIDAYSAFGQVILSLVKINCDRNCERVFAFTQKTVKLSTNLC